MFSSLRRSVIAESVGQLRVEVSIVIENTMTMRWARSHMQQSKAMVNWLRFYF